MGVKMTGLLDAESLILRLDSNAKRRVVKSLVKKAYEIQEMAIKMAPVDEGDLEKAIKVKGDMIGREKNFDTGQFIKTEVEVYIDGNLPLEHRPGYTVGDYAYEIHEYLEPMPGAYMHLGAKSQDKQSGQQEIVGGGFLERAALHFDTIIDKALLESLEDFL